VSRVAGLLLAAGRGSRFGGDKLRTELDGVPLFHHAARTMAAVDLAWRFAVIAGGSPPPGFDPVVNRDPAAGQGRSLALGVTVARQAGADAVLVMLADMPCVSEAHLRRLLDRHLGSDTLVTSGDGVTRMPPALFGRRWFPALEALTGDQGARDLIGRAELVEAGAAELGDIDRPADLAALRRSGAPAK
jgi:molybdenum cofactor cytidylyltransferase